MDVRKISADANYKDVTGTRVLTGRKITSHVPITFALDLGCSAID